MRILQAINSLSAGGAESVSVQLAIAQQQAGHEVEFFTYAGVLDDKGRELEARLAAAGIAHVSANARSLAAKLAAPALMASRVRRLGIEVVHTHLEQTDLCAMLGAALAPGRQVRHVRTLHNVFAAGFSSPWLHRRLAGFFDASVACGPAVFERYPFRVAERWHLIENGIDLSRLPGDSGREALRARFGWGEGERVFLNIGALSERDNTLQKAQDVLLQAMAQLGGEPFRLVFLGDGECRAALEAMAQSLGVAERCLFAGRVANPYDYIVAADVLVMPSRFEGLSIAAIEAACLGKPLLLSDIDAFRGFAGPASAFVPVEDARRLAAGMRDVGARLASMSAEARARSGDYRRQFDIREVAERYVRLYQSCAVL